MDIMAEPFEYHGSLVAFEGPQETISTQLRLLPNSPKLLILPSFQVFVQESEGPSQFDAQSLILRTHEACRARTEMACSFLRESTPNDKRLVFMNGSTISARMSCISAISKHETNGDMNRAEIRFNELIENGTAGLQRRSWAEQSPAVPSIADVTTGSYEQARQVADDPISKAMRAADALYLETEFLQDNDDFDLVTPIRPRSMSVPVLLADDLRTTTPFNIFGSTENTEQDFPTDVEQQDLVRRCEDWQAAAEGEDHLTDIPSATMSPNRGSELYPYNPLRPTSAVGPPRTAVDSMPNSPVLLGEARIVDIRPSPSSSTLKRVKSVDGIYTTAFRNPDISLCNISQRSTKSEEAIQDGAIKEWKEEEHSLRKPILRSHFYSEASYPALKTNRAIVRKFLPPKLNLDIEGARRSIYYANQSIREEKIAHRGTLTEPILNTREAEPEDNGSFLDLENDLEPGVQEPFQVVLPMVEDLVIHFKGEESQPALEAMIQTFKNRTSQLSMLSLISELRGSMNHTMTPTTKSSAPYSSNRDSIYSRRPTLQSTPRYSPADYDPFAVHGNYLERTTSGSSSKLDSNNQVQETVVISTPPTPAQTPPPGTNPLPDQLFHDFDIKGYKTAICVQNALRSILNIHFSPENIGYQQFNFPLLPELSSFWRPVFRETRSRNSNMARKIDLILALGAQKNTSRGLLGSVSGSLEKLGREANGTPRTGRVDLRYLIANAMQAFTSQPLANQTQANPFTNPLLLATLIIPHLETYIAAHPSTRFLLLEYPAEHLSTVLSLQDLIGADILKVAGIVDPEANEPKPYQAHRKHSSHSIVSSPRSSASRRPSAALLPSELSEVRKELYTSQPSFSKVDFVLTSNAEESEIATFIATIWKLLIGISDFYIPESATITKWKSKPNNYSLPSSSHIHSAEQYAPLFQAAVMLGFASPAEDEQEPHRRGPSPNYVSSGTYADLPAIRQRPATPFRPSKASLVAASRNGGSIPQPPTIPRRVSNPRNKLKYLLGHEVASYTAPRDTENGDVIPYHEFYDLDEDGGFLAEERKYMPLWTQQHQSGLPNRNSHKALKWLGISN
ncbi:hypothetical protein NPX13_g9135 [Xylaria arbuscula]|uniref:Gastric mucin-like protein n=1 Tax=Xylaria arbuscula TaxID=114810 RepID=A0A9W8N7J5_9PEZI|nr:hypothetical protein NPX13_g9135 [Xylaria arbuscula]